VLFSEMLVGGLRSWRRKTFSSPSSVSPKSKAPSSVFATEHSRLKCVYLAVSECYPYAVVTVEFVKNNT
jgi:hypothetical protein